jgi:DNA polymerase-1
VDREALDKIIKAAGDPKSAATLAAPFAHICLAISDLSKSLGFLNCKLEHGLFKASFGAVTDTGRLASRQNAQGFGSNAQNVTPKLRHIFVAPPGEKFVVCDYGQIESRIVAAICYRLFGLKNYIAGTESGDLHSLAASMVWPDLPWPEDFKIEWCIKHGAFPKDMLKVAKGLASKEFYRGKSRRDVSKTLGHGTSYCGKPPQMSKHSHIEVKLIEHYQEVFFAAFPEIAKWHRWVAEQVQTTGEITTMLGRTRRFFGRPNDDATIRKAVAYEPQSVAADYCNRALLRLHNLVLVGKFPGIIRLTKHDELVVSFPEPLEEEVLATMREQMEEHITLISPTGETRDWFVPAEVESGWNLGRYSTTNLNGISHPLDGRERIMLNEWKGWKL